VQQWTWGTREYRSLTVAARRVVQSRRGCVFHMSHNPATPLNRISAVMRQEFAVDQLAARETFLRAVPEIDIGLIHPPT